MQERRVRLGDILDDYCPRERRITNHAVVAIVENDVKQTRCTTCDADHVYKHAKMPTVRRKKPTGSTGELPEPEALPTFLSAEAATTEIALPGSPPEAVPEETAPPTSLVAAEAVESITPDVAGDEEASEPAGSDGDDDWPVHRPLIRATLPRPEGQAPERKAPDFFHQTGGRPDRNGNRQRDNRRPRGAQGRGAGQSSSPMGAPRSGHGPRHGGGQFSGNSQRQDSQPGQRGDRQPGQGGQRSGQGRRPKRGGR